MALSVDFAAQVDHHPLRVQRVVFAGESFGQIGIALPVRFQVAIGEPRPAVAVAPAEAAMRQRVQPRPWRIISPVGSALPTK